MTGGAGRARPSELDHPLSPPQPHWLVSDGRCIGLRFWQKTVRWLPDPLPERRWLFIPFPNGGALSDRKLPSSGSCRAVLLLYFRMASSRIFRLIRRPPVRLPGRRGLRSPEVSSPIPVAFVADDRHPRVTSIGSHEVGAVSDNVPRRNLPMRSFMRPPMHGKRGPGRQQRRSSPTSSRSRTIPLPRLTKPCARVDFHFYPFSAVSLDVCPRHSRNSGRSFSALPDRASASSIWSSRAKMSPTAL